MASGFGAKKLGFNIEIMDPKTFSCPYHYHTEKPFKYFVLSSKSTDEICYYPDSNKKSVSAERLMTQNGVKVDYFKDEEDPGKYWPKDRLYRRQNFGARFAVTIF